MNIKNYEDIDSLIPGIYAFINENVAVSETEKLEVGRTVTALLVAPDYFILADEESEDPDAVKNVRIEPNKLYVVSDPAKLLSTIRGEHLRADILTDSQKESMRSPQLESACQIAADLGKTFAYIKIVKRDGTSPDINNVHEMYEAHEHALERIKTVNAGCLKPFGYSLLKDRFILSDDEVVSAVSFTSAVGPASFVGLSDGFIIDKTSLDIEKDFEVKVEMKPVIDAASLNVSNLASAYAEVLTTNDVVTTPVISKVPVKYVEAFAFNGVNVPALVISEDTEVELVHGQLGVTLLRDTLVATVGVNLLDGSLLKDTDGAFITNYDPTKDVTTQKMGALQFLTVSATASRNPYVRVESIIDKTYLHGIKPLQGVNNDGVRNYNPSKSNSYILTFELSDDKKKASAFINGAKVLDNTLVVKKETNTNLYTLTKAAEVKTDTGVVLILPVGLKVQDLDRLPLTIVDPINYNIVEEVKNQHSYKINVVPSTADFAGMYANASYELTVELDQTRTVLSTTGLDSDSYIEVPKIVDQLVALGMKGKYVGYINASKAFDLGKYLIAPIGSLKTISGIGGYKPDKNFRVMGYDLLRPTDTTTKKLYLTATTALKKGDLVELSTIKKLNVVKESHKIVNLTTIGAKTIVELENAFSTVKFDLKQIVTLSTVNLKDTKGDYISFQYALISEDYSNKTPYMKVIAGTAEVTFNADDIKKLEKAGYTVINQDDTVGTAKVACTPNFSISNSEYQNQVQLGILFYILRACKAIGKAYEGTQLNDVIVQDGFKKKVQEVADTCNKVLKITNSCVIAPNFATAGSGVVRVNIEFDPAIPVGKIIFTGNVIKK